MTIEVKQMIIKATVEKGQNSRDRSELNAVDIEELRKKLLAECSELIADNMNELRER